MEFKTEEVKKGWDKLHPILKDLVLAVDLWSQKYDKKPITLTCTLSTPELDKKLGRLSPAHTQGRAVDIRTSDMPKPKLIMLMQYFTERFKHLGYTSQTGVRRLMYYHDNGNGPHIHLAIGLDVIEKYKGKYPQWNFPEHKPKKEKENGKSV